MSTAGDDQGELRIGGWLPPAELPATADDGQVTQVIPAVPAQPRPARSGPGHNPGGEPVDEPRRRGRRTAVAVAVSVATVAVAAGVPLLMSASDQPKPDQRVLPAPTASGWPDESPAALPTQRPSRPPASRGAVRGAQHSTPPPATGTRPPDKAAAPKTTVTLEAEAADLDGWASTRRVDSASGGRVVTRIGYRRSTLTFTTPAVPRAGEYDVVVYYVADDRRRAEVEVNGHDAGRFEFASTGSWESVKTMTVRLPLAAGPNTVEISNSDGWAPDLDRITLTY